MKEQSKNKDWKKAIVFLGPSLILLIIFVFIPMFKTLYTSFFSTNILGTTTKFIGLDNYKALLKSSAYLKSLGSTLVFVILSSVITITVGLFCAYLATKKLPGIGLFRTTFSSTMGVSISVAAIFWLFIFNPSVGLITKILTSLHLTLPNMLTSPIGAMIAIIVSTVWMNLGFTFLILFGAMQSVPQYLYEYADIMGMSKRVQFFRITLPMISPTTFFVLVVTLIETFKSFGLIDLMTAGGPNNATNFLVYRIYQDAFINGNYASASAQSIILAIIIGIFTIIQFKLLEKKVNY